MQEAKTNLSWRWIAALLLVASPAYGYIDPGPGHILVQLVVAMFAGSLFYVRRIWGFFKGLYSRSKAKGKPDATNQADKEKQTDRAA